MKHFCSQYQNSSKLQLARSSYLSLSGNQAASAPKCPLTKLSSHSSNGHAIFGLIVTFTSPPARLLCTSTGRKINCSPSSSINSTFDNAGNKCRIQINFCKPLPWLDMPNKLILFKLWQIMDPMWSSSFESESFASPCCPSIQEIFALCKVLYWASPNHHLHYPSRRHL